MRKVLAEDFFKRFGPRVDGGGPRKEDEVECTGEIKVRAELGQPCEDC